MTNQQFEQVVVLALSFLEADCKNNPDCYKKSGEDFEACVKTAVEYALGNLGLDDRIDYTLGGHAFPDIVIVGNDGNKYGIEVKSSTGTGNSWRINGNSVLGSTRVPGIIRNKIIFGKIRGENSLFRAKDYEKCIANVVVTHSPRYLIDLELEEGEGFFEKAHLEYKEISESNQPIKRITDYFLSIGQRAWWLAESTPAAIQMFGKLPTIQQNKLRGYAFVHFPEIFSRCGTKFYRYMSWLASENSVVDPTLRDHFTAGGQDDVILSEVVYPKLPHIFTNLHKCRKEVLDEIYNADLSTLESDWHCKPETNPDERIHQWIGIVASQLHNQNLGDIDTKQMLEDIVTDS